MTMFVTSTINMYWHFLPHHFGMGTTWLEAYENSFQQLLNFTNKKMVNSIHEGSVLCTKGLPQITLYLMMSFYVCEGGHDWYSYLQEYYLLRIRNIWILQWNSIKQWNYKYPHSVRTMTMTELAYTKGQLIAIGSESEYRLNLETLPNRCIYNICSEKKIRQIKRKSSVDATNNEFILPNEKCLERDFITC